MKIYFKISEEPIKIELDAYDSCKKKRVVQVVQKKTNRVIICANDTCALPPPAPRLHMCENFLGDHKENSFS